MTANRPISKLVYAAIAVCAVLCAADTSLAARISVLAPKNEGPFAKATNAAVERLEGLGHQVEVIESAADADRPEVIVCIGPDAVRDARSGSVPLAYCMVSGHPKQVPERSGGVTTVLDTSAATLIADRAIGGCRSIGVLIRGSSAASSRWLDLIKSGAGGREIVAIDLDAFGSTADAVDALVDRDPCLIWMIPDSKVYDSASVRAVLLAAIRAKIPTLGFSKQVVKAGATIGFGIDPSSQGRSAADEADAISTGRDGQRRTAAPLLTINLVSADRIDIDMPRDIIREADEVFE